MKRLLFLASGCTFLFASCEKEPGPTSEEVLSSLNGTTWVNQSVYFEGTLGKWSWARTELNFTASQATYTAVNSADTNSSFTGTYTYDPPAVVIYSDNWTLSGSPPTGTFVFPYMIEHEGTIEGNTMYVEIHFTDEVHGMNLLKQ